MRVAGPARMPEFGGLYMTSRSRFAVPASLFLLAACSGGGAPPATTPAPAAPPSMAPATADATATAGQSVGSPSAPAKGRTGPVLPPAPPPLTEAEELAALQRVAADSAADMALLDAVRENRGEARGHAGPIANPLEANGVTWDIDVSPYEDHDRVQYWLEFFQGPAKQRFGIWLERMARYEPMIRARLAQQNLPGDLVYLALIESGFSNHAVSRAKAVGMWQFMRPTATDMGLRVDRWVDERRDPVRATDAAARHLDMLRRRFGSLYLAAAAYNAGGGKVSRSLRALERMRPAQGDDGAGEAEDEADEGWSDDHFFQLYDTRLLRQETKDYVPKLIAAAIISKEPQKYGFTELQPVEPFAADSIIVDDMTGLDVVARVAGTSVTTIRELNPQFLRWATPPGRASIVRVPPGTGESARVAYAALEPSERVTFATHVAREGETLTQVARRYGTSVAALKEANPGVTRLRPGTRLLVPRGGAVSLAAARSVRAAEAAEYHRVRRGETATRIALRYGISVAELTAWNRGKVSKRGGVTVGTRLLVSEPAAAPPLARVDRAPAAPRLATRATLPGATSSAKATALTSSMAVASGKAAPATRSHVVRHGDTLTSLARRYGVSVKQLQSANRLAGGDIRIGQRLRIPRG
jgi:membrane-bound lytic murein transglycosylase D